MSVDVSPKDRFITVYGRNPVLEALADESVTVDKVMLALGLRGETTTQVERAARSRGVPVQRIDAQRLKKLAGNGKQDQGVCADVVAPRMRPLSAALEDGLHGPILVLDGITTPANVGMILRTATAAGVSGVVVPRRGVASLDPLVVKASAGVAFRAPILKCATAQEAVGQLRDHGYAIAALDASGDTSLFDAHLPDDTAYVLGSETTGPSVEVRGQVGHWLHIPMHADVESLNVAAAAAVVCFEVTRG